MTLVVATALADTPDALYEAARRAAEHADWVEVRLDGPSGLPWDLRAYFSFGKPCLATVRHALDGGRTEMDDRARADLLRRALRAGARGIDVEAWSDEAASLVKEAKAEGALAVVSRHVLDGTPSEEQLVEMLREARALGADVAKVATSVRAPADAAALVRAAARARDEGIRFALMAVNDPFLRLLAPQLGMELAYASIPAAAAATPGQVPADALRAAWRAAAPAAPRASSGRTRAVFLLGHPVAHSRSPAMQDAAFAAAGVDARYLALDVAPERLAPALAGLKATDALGCNLTIPHKEAALALMDELDASAREAGAVNTIVFREGRALGHNTDGAGALDALREAGVKLPGARTLVLGAGGAARAVAHALRGAGADVTVTNRTAARADALGFPTIPWERVPDVLRNVDLLVNATSLGLRGERVPAPMERMLPGAAILDCVYGDTPLAREAAERGILVARGEAMLVHQGARAFALWTGKPAPVHAMKAALEAAR
ncbi:MAG TPA: shikimate dehydrogenase [Candidatus Thermoplasmatota archaeon]|nr:shikimate dehydrogenase [Candidatus Thermoplasmatota archaeon]